MTPPGPPSTGRAFLHKGLELLGKRSDFERHDRDFYATPLGPVLKLAPFVAYQGRPFRYVEPCAGEGDLIRHLDAIGGKCTWRSDLPVDARTIDEFWCTGADWIITNPPWPRPGNASLTLEIIMRCMKLRPTWVLLSADFAHNAYFGDIEIHCRRIVSVGRVKWIAGTDTAGKDNAAWYQFSQWHTVGPRYHNMIGPDDE